MITSGNRSIQVLAGLCLIGLLLAGCSTSPVTNVTLPTSSPTLPAPTPTVASNVYWPTDEWRTAFPESQGVDPKKLTEMLTTIEQRHLGLHSLLIIRNGYLVSENYFGPYQPTTRHQLYSVTKSFIATLIGIALDKGYIKGTDQRMVDFFPEQTFDNPDERKTAMRLDDTLTMRTGLDWEEGDPAYRALYVSPDWVKYMLDEAMITEPGTQFNYCSGCSHLLSAVLAKTTEMNPRDFAEQYLFKPLGIKDARWDVDGEGVPIGGWGLQLTPRDMAKLGYLYLHKGQWDGQQIIPAEWVENATRTHTQTDGELGYGYQWWTYPALEGYVALGRGGQTVMVIPKLDLIIVTTAEMGGHDEVFWLIQHYILPAVQDRE